MSGSECVTECPGESNNTDFSKRSCKSIQIIQSSAYPFPFIIISVILVLFVGMSRVFVRATSFTGNCSALLGVMEFFVWIVAAAAISKATNSAQKAFVPMILAVVFLLLINFPFALILCKKIVGDAEFTSWKKRKPRIKLWNGVVFCVCVATTFKFGKVIFSKLLGQEIFSARFSDMNRIHKLYNYNSLMILLFAELPAIIGGIIGITSSQSNEQILRMSIEVVIVTLFAILFSLLDARKLAPASDSPAPAQNDNYDRMPAGGESVAISVLDHSNIAQRSGIDPGSLLNQDANLDTVPGRLRVINKLRKGKNRLNMNTSADSFDLGSQANNARAANHADKSSFLNTTALEGINTENDPQPKQDKSDEAAASNELNNIDKIDKIEESVREEEDQTINSVREEEKIAVIQTLSRISPEKRIVEIPTTLKNSPLKNSPLKSSPLKNSPLKSSPLKAGLDLLKRVFSCSPSKQDQKNKESPKKPVLSDSTNNWKLKLESPKYHLPIGNISISTTGADLKSTSNEMSLSTKNAESSTLQKSIDKPDRGIEKTSSGLKKPDSTSHDISKKITAFRKKKLAHSSTQRASLQHPKLVQASNSKSPGNSSLKNLAASLASMAKENNPNAAVASSQDLLITANFVTRTESSGRIAAVMNGDHANVGPKASKEFTGFKEAYDPLKSPTANRVTRQHTKNSEFHQYSTSYLGEFGTKSELSLQSSASFDLSGLGSNDTNEDKPRYELLVNQRKNEMQDEVVLTHGEESNYKRTEQELTKNDNNFFAASSMAQLDQDDPVMSPERNPFYENCETSVSVKTINDETPNDYNLVNQRFENNEYDAMPMKDITSNWIRQQDFQSNQLASHGYLGRGGSVEIGSQPSKKSAQKTLTKSGSARVDRIPVFQMNPYQQKLTKKKSSAVPHAEDPVAQTKLFIRPPLHERSSGNRKKPFEQRRISKTPPPNMTYAQSQSKEGLPIHENGAGTAKKVAGLKSRKPREVIDKKANSSPYSEDLVLPMLYKPNTRRNSSTPKPDLTKLQGVEQFVISKLAVMAQGNTASKKSEQLEGNNEEVNNRMNSETNDEDCKIAK